MLVCSRNVVRDAPWHPSRAMTQPAADAASVNAPELALCTVGFCFFLPMNESICCSFSASRCAAALQCVAIMVTGGAQDAIPKMRDSHRLAAWLRELYEQRADGGGMDKASCVLMTAASQRYSNFDVSIASCTSSFHLMMYIDRVTRRRHKSVVA